jgi:hypothetical protein
MHGRIYSNEGGSARDVLISMYGTLKKNYSNLGFRNEFFEMDFLWENSSINMWIKYVKKNAPPIYQGNNRLSAFSTL